MENPDTRGTASLYEALEPEVARRLPQRSDVHYTPKRGRRLEIAETESGVPVPGRARKWGQAPLSRAIRLFSLSQPTGCRCRSDASTDPRGRAPCGTCARISFSLRMFYASVPPSRQCGRPVNMKGWLARGRVLAGVFSYFFCLQAPQVVWYKLLTAAGAGASRRLSNVRRSPMPLSQCSNEPRAKGTSALRPAQRAGGLARDAAGGGSKCP
jgi:hypothetical protein